MQLIYLMQIVYVFLFLVFFGILHFIFKQPITKNKKLLFLVLIFACFALAWKGGNGFYENEWYDIDLYSHLNLNGDFNLNGFFLFFLIKDFFVSLIGLNSTRIFLPVFFGAISYYVFLSWLNKKKKINLFVLGLSLFVLFKFQQFVFSFSRDSIIIMLSILFLFFLEKWHDSDLKKYLFYSLIFLGLALFTKLTSIFLFVILFVFFLLKKRSWIYFLPFVLLILFLWFFTDFFSSIFSLGHLPIRTVLLPEGDFILENFINNILSRFPLFFFVLFIPFINLRKFLFKLCFIAFALILFVSWNNGYLFYDLHTAWGTAYRYFAIFYFPLFVWLSEESGLFWERIRAKPFRAWFKKEERKN